MAESALAEVGPGTVFVRASFDQRARATLEVTADGFMVRHEGFNKQPWAWEETPEVRRIYDAEQADVACRYFNSLLLSPGYLGPVRLEPDKATT